MYAAILAGGVGSRLWPRSRQNQPKQFSDITGAGRTMIQATADRLDGLVDAGSIYIVTGAQYAELTRSQLPALQPEQVLLEPNGRNTAPAIGLACSVIADRDPTGVLAILPADHVIPDVATFQKALRRAEKVAQAGYIVTLGITPTFAHTGYGYIKRGAPIDHAALNGQDDLPAYEVEEFLEKPNRTTAEAFLADGGYSWNGGIFIARADVMLDEIARQLPELAAGLDKIAQARRQDPANAAAVLAEVWPTLPSISIDHGVMEGAQKVAIVPLDAGWNDVGSWDALASIIPCNDDNNHVASGDLLTIDSHNNIVYCGDRLVALIGVENLVVVDTGDTLLIGHKQQMQKVKDVVERLKAQGRSELL